MNKVSKNRAPATATNSSGALTKSSNEVPDMADQIVSLHKIEFLLAFLLALAAIVTVARWNAPCCGVLLMYFAIRVLLYGLLTVGV